MALFLSGLLAAIPIVAAQTATAQNYTGVTTITPEQVAQISYNTTAHDGTTFQIYDPTFKQILGNNPYMELVLSADQPYFHEAGVYYSDNPVTIYSVSNQFNTASPSPATAGKQIVIVKIVQDPATGKFDYTVLPLPPNAVPLANGGFGYKTGVIFTAQGNLDVPGGLVYVDVSDPSYPYTTLLDNFLGTEFDSPNDIHVTPQGDIYFTDPSIGASQGIRPAPKLPQQVYVWRPNTTQVRVVAEGVGTPNGIVFSPDYKTAYITSTPASNDPTIPRVIYAFDVTASQTGSGAPSWSNKRVFAYVPIGYADGIKADTRGNIWAGVGDGITVWNPDGVQIGKISLNSTVNNWCFGPNGVIYVFFGKQLLVAHLNPTVQPAVLPQIPYDSPSKYV